MPVVIRLVFGAYIFISSNLYADEILKAENLRMLGERAQHTQVPVLLLVSQEHCSFCKTLKEEILQPMEISGDYTHRVLIAELLMDLAEPIVGWQGKPTFASEVAAKYKVYVTPTLLFLDARGEPLHEPMIGINTVEMYSYYLDEALAKALKRLHSR